MQMQASIAVIAKENLEQRASNTITDPLAVSDFAVLIPKFIDYLKYEIRNSSQTIVKYEECLYWFIRDLPHLFSPADIQLDDITTLKKKMASRGCSEARINSVIFALRAFLKYCNQDLNITTINPKSFRPMKIPKRQVVFLTKEEVNQLLDNLNINDIRDLRMRALMELLLGTGMRITEALSLNRQDIDVVSKEMMIIGKGNKQRTIFLTDRALEWIQKYLAKRKDTHEALFVTFGTVERLARFDLSKQFRFYANRAGIRKKVTPHVLRHTAATIMLQNGCDIRYIQELLGHADIQTTAQYYLGTDKSALKEAHAKFLQFN